MQAAILAPANTYSRSYDRKNELLNQTNRFPGALRQLTYPTTGLAAAVMLLFACDDIREVLLSRVLRRTWDRSLAKDLTEETVVSIFEQLKLVFSGLIDLSTPDKVQLSALGVGRLAVMICMFY